MDKRARLILERARELHARAHPGQPWPAEQANTDEFARQAKYLAQAEDELLKQGEIESVDQS
jgi:hypothetical protein